MVFTLAGETNMLDSKEIRLLNMCSQVLKLSSIVITQMEEMNKLVSDLSVIATKEKFMLDKCEDLLASTAVMEVVTNQNTIQESINGSTR